MRSTQGDKMQDALISCSERVSKLIWEEYFKNDSPFRFQSSFTTDQFEAILALIGMYSSSLILDFYKQVSTVDHPESPSAPEPQSASDAVD